MVWKRIAMPALLLALSVTCFLLIAPLQEAERLRERGGRRSEARDNDWFMLQRVYPNNDIAPGRYDVAREAVRAMQSVWTESGQPVWQPAGPTNIGGRITSLALHPVNTNIIYAGAAAGGVWKSENGGATWTNIFNESPSTGSLLLDPTNPDVVYVGTGESNPGGVAIYPGNGIWRSTDAGQSWTNLGLENTGQLGRIAIHPSTPSRIYVAALGLYRSRTQERGVYRSTDAGASWQRVHFLNDTTGACEVMIDPLDPNRIYAAMWTRYRPLTYSVITSENTSLWISTDAGNSWSPVSNGFPYNDSNLGRVRLAYAPSSPATLYALASNGTGVRGVFKSTDSGNSWTQTATGSAFSSGEGQVWYNNYITVHPTNDNTLFVGMTSMYRSTNGGTSWSTVTGSMHVDQHAIVFDPGNPNRLIVGNDGGVFSSTNLGTSWVKSFHLPVSQFYAGTMDFSNPNRLYGGMQDNGTARTMSGSPDTWSSIYGGDGFYVLVDPTNPNRIYVESQNGGFAYSTNGGTSFSNGRTGINSADRRNWSTPFAMDLSSPLTLYAGTYRIYRTTNGMQNWSPISGDLTRGENGRIGTITTIDVSAVDPGVIYAGADDGTVSVTTDGGSTWSDISAGLPVRWVTRVVADPESANVAYVTHSGYLEYLYASHVHRTSDYGQSWTSISGNLPDMPVNDIIIDPLTRYLYAATDFNVMYSTNQGQFWQPLGTGFPEVPVHDLTLHSPTRKLAAFTHGRSALTADLNGLVAVSEAHTPPMGIASLLQNYPNPFNPSTTIGFSIPEPGLVTLRVFDLAGREVRTLIREHLSAGAHSSRFDGTAIASGTYVYALSVGNAVFTRRMTLVK